VMKDLSLSKVYQLLEPGPVVLLTTTCNGRQRDDDVLAYDGRV
jgi:hypothetical protein